MLWEIMVHWDKMLEWLEDGSSDRMQIKTHPDPVYIHGQGVVEPA